MIPTRLPWEPPPPAPAPINGTAPAGFAWHEFRTAGGDYGRTALEREAAMVRGTMPGGRNHALNRAAFSIGQLVADGRLDRGEAYRALYDAGIAAGLTDAEVRRTLSSGFTGGAAKPRTAHQTTGLLLPSSFAAPPTGPEGAESDEDSEWTGRTAPGGAFVLDAPPMPPAVWGAGQSVIWAQGEALMLCGPAGVGKTTVAVQLVAGRLGLAVDELFGLPIRPGAHNVLYLAMDRPPQISRAMARLFSEDDRRALDAKLVVWKGPPPRDLARQSDILAQMCAKAKADTVVVDSLKDAATKLSDDEVGGGYNRARQRALVEGIEVLELHHQRKAGGDNKRPSKLDDVYGSTWLTAGAGSVVLLWGEPGDPVVELAHLKQPAEQVGPWTVVHDHAAGRSVIDRQPDVITLVRYQGGAGMTAKLLAGSLFHGGGNATPTRGEVEKARRRLEGLERDGLLRSEAGVRGGTETVWWIADG